MIESVTHPVYDKMVLKWQKWRILMEDTDGFITKYLEQYSARESWFDFKARRNITPCPAYAKASLIEIRNSIYQCLSRIQRIGGSPTYRDAITGVAGGVDGQGNTLDYFIGLEVLHELLAMRRVGIYVDRPRGAIVTRADAARSRPYAYIYKAEQIRSWALDEHGLFTKVLLEDVVPNLDPQTGLPTGETKQYRFLERTPEGVKVSIYDAALAEPLETVILNLPQIPFHVAEISESLLDATAGYQVALLNMESSDISYILKANYPFYTEQYAPTASHFTNEATEENEEVISVGTTQGRRYGKGLERPGFIHPSSEPLEASMKKQESMKQTIRHLMQLTIASLKPIRESAESKDRDQSGLKAGLSYIGMELERAERMMALIWSQYERSEVADVHYPEEYDISTLTDRLSEAEKLRGITNLPSATYQKEVAKLIAESLFRYRLSQEAMTQITEELSAAPAVVLNADTLNADVESGIIDPATAADIRGYPEGTAKLAAEAHVKKLTAIAAAQTVRGVTNTPVEQDRFDPSRPTGKAKLRGDAKK